MTAAGGRATMKLSKWFACFWIVLTILTDTTGCAGTNSNLDFFRGKTVTIIVPHGPGGMDTYARAIAPFLQKYLPGSKVEVQNVPEGGGITGRNQIYAAAPDGLTLGLTTNAGALLAEWAEQPGVQYKTADFSYIGRINAEAHIMVVSPRTGFTTLDDIVHAGKISMGFSGVGSDDYYVALITARLLQYQVEARTDFSGINGASLACVKGEVDAILFSESSVRSQIEAQTVVPIVSFSNTPSPNLPNVPTIFDVIPADKREMMRALVQIYALERVLIAPPNMSMHRLQTLREALDKVMADPDFQENMVKINRPINYLTGAETTQLLENILSSEDQIKPLVIEIAQGSK
jgi:tripartite-type tricarboxylate transporter receptor subunit TctC